MRSAFLSIATVMVALGPALAADDEDNDGFTANVNGTEEYRIPYIVLDGDI